jgi:hypothetical protein
MAGKQGTQFIIHCGIAQQRPQVAGCATLAVDCEASATATPAMNSFFFIPILPQFRSENLRKKRVNGRYPFVHLGVKICPQIA